MISILQGIDYLPVFPACSVAVHPFPVYRIPCQSRGIGGVPEMNISSTFKHAGIHKAEIRRTGLKDFDPCSIPLNAMLGTGIVKQDPVFSDIGLFRIKNIIAALPSHSRT